MPLSRLLLGKVIQNGWRRRPLLCFAFAAIGTIVASCSLWFGVGRVVVAILIATINIAGGFFVTQRMLKMFVRED